MIITKPIKTSAIVILLFSFLYSTNLFGISAQTVDCDPLPEDPELVLECNMQDIESGQGREYEPGTDPGNPINFGANGTWGIAAGYSSTSDSVLIAAHHSANERFSIMGFMADPKNLGMKGPAFRIDSATGGFRGSPKIAFSEEADKFLVVWQDTRPCGDNCVSAYGRFVSSAGLPMGASDFSLNKTGSYIGGVAVDPVNKRFVVGFEGGKGEGISYKTVDFNGTVSNNFAVVSSFPYQGQMGLTVNTVKNEYWFTYAVTLSGGSTANEDDRIMLSRIKADTGNTTSQPLQLSQTRLGGNGFQAGKIAYSSHGGGAMAAWMERGREGTIAGIWGRTINDDGTMTDEYPIITPQTNHLSSGYGDHTINYNPWTETFFVSSGDWDGGAWLTEIDISGLVYEHQYAIAAIQAAAGNFLQKLAGIFIKKVLAQAVGSFNVTNTVTKYGAVTLASRNLSAVVGTSFKSPNVPLEYTPITTTPRPPQEVEVDKLPRLINQIYVWSLGVSVLLALLMAVLGGYYYMTSAGNAEQSAKGKEYITSALIGLVIIFTAYLLLNQINPDLVRFNLDSLKGLNN